MHSTDDIACKVKRIRSFSSCIFFHSPISRHILLHKFSPTSSLNSSHKLLYAHCSMYVCVCSDLEPLHFQTIFITFISGVANKFSTRWNCIRCANNFRCQNGTENRFVPTVSQLHLILSLLSLFRSHAFSLLVDWQHNVPTPPSFGEVFFNQIFNNIKTFLAPGNHS